MTVELDDDRTSEAIFDMTYWALENELWNGRHVTVEDATDMQNEVLEKIFQKLLSYDESSLEFQEMAEQLAWMGTSGSEQYLLEKEIEALDFSKNDMIEQAGFWKSVSKFWKKHKKEIIIGAIVVAVVTTVAVVSVCSGGAAAAPATAAAGGALTSAKRKEEEDEAPPKEKKPTQGSSPPKDPLSKASNPSPFPKSYPQFQDENLLNTNFEDGALFPLGMPDKYWYEDMINNGSVSSLVKFPFDVDDCNALKPFEAKEESSFSKTVSEINRGSEELGKIRFQDSFNVNKDHSANLFSGLEAISLQGKNPTAIPDRKNDIRYCIGGINGINTTKLGAESHASYIKKLANNYDVNWTYNRTHTAPVDIAEVFTMNYFGFSPNTAREMQNKWVNFHRMNKDNPNAKYLHFCHSQGAIHTKNALMNCPKIVKDRVIVVAIAPAAVVPRKICHQSYNYASKNDIVPYGEIIFSEFFASIGEYKSLEKAFENRKELILLDPHPDVKGIDHDFQSPTFEQKIREHTEKYLKGDYEN